MASSFELTILGSSSATPTSKRHPTAQLLNIAERFFLIDCGEATQIQLRRYHIRFQRINHIFISHMHGDHYLGLMGLLSSLHLLGRKTPLHLYHPPGLKEVIDIQLDISKTVLNYEIVWHPHPEQAPALIFEDQLLTVETIPLNHRIPCYGFLFREKPRAYVLKKEEVEARGIPRSQMVLLKRGLNAVLEDGTVIPNSELTLGQRKSRAYAFCSDTRIDPKVIESVRNVDLLYHESTFLHEMIDRAMATYHSTAREAGIVAREAGVEKLVIGHFSVRYTDLHPLLEEARAEFPATHLGEEGAKFSIAEQLIVKK
jgi:ribonuclease Z